MPVITIAGPIGGGAVTIGQMVAESLEINFLDRVIFTQAARLVGTPVGVLIDKEQRVVRFRDKLGRFLQAMLERSAMSGVSGEPYFGRGIEMLPPESYMEASGESGVATHKVDDKKFLEATTSVVNDVYRAGNAVIIGRFANLLLADTPGVMHVGLLASMEVRVQTMMAREHFDREEAEVHVEELERARVNFYRKHFKVHPDEAKLYHVMLNMDKMQPKTAAEVIVHASGDLTA